MLLQKMMQEQDVDNVDMSCRLVSKWCKKDVQVPIVKVGAGSMEKSTERVEKIRPRGRESLS
jgi:hypothetical protein